jgi:hypothetical protein
LTKREQWLQIAFLLFCIAANTAMLYFFITQEIRDTSPGGSTPGLGMAWLFMTLMSCFIGIPMGVIIHCIIWYRVLKRN